MLRFFECLHFTHIITSNAKNSIFLLLGKANLFFPPCPKKKKPDYGRGLLYHNNKRNIIYTIKKKIKTFQREKILSIFISHSPTRVSKARISIPHFRFLKFFKSLPQQKRRNTSAREHTHRNSSSVM